ncbi:MAG: hypothetical protein GX754_03585 [Clostridiaceae bacterium]|nr:hypothetical protein [Clostridiaceae bacterium]
MKKVIGWFKTLKAETIVANLIRVMFVLAVIVSLLNGIYLDAFIAAFTLFLTFLPSIIVKKSCITLPPSFQVVILLFIFAANYLGSYRLYYEKFWWWDSMLHGLSGLMLGFAGFLLVYIINGAQKLNVSLSPLFVAIFAFAFSLSIGALWEIYEFTMDSLFGLNLQRTGLDDTMWDLILDASGALVASVSGYLYEKNRKDGIFKRMFTKFISMNSHFFTDNTQPEKDGGE